MLEASLVTVMIYGKRTQRVERKVLTSGGRPPQTPRCWGEALSPRPPGDPLRGSTPGGQAKDLTRDSSSPGKELRNSWRSRLSLATIASCSPVRPCLE